ncbi:CASP-like protein 1U2 [Setaria italica]|nr:CASP-like protein 1U2 [Setaria italica]
MMPPDGHVLPIPSDGHVMMPDGEPNGSKAVTLLLRLCTMGLALASAIVMATANECTIDGDGDDGAAAATTVTYKDYPPFAYLVGSNIAATILEMAAIYLQTGKGDNGDEEAPVLPRVVLVVVDVAVQVLLYSSSGAAFAAVAAYGVQTCGQVNKAKFIGLGASLAAGLAAFVKDVPLPFSMWPSPSE